MLTFVTGGFLYFLAACSIPIILHLIFRNRYKRIHWAAMRFLLAAYKTTKNTIFLENLLLLILRILVILFLVGMFARPKLQSSIGGSETGSHIRNFILVLDNSYSMGLRSNNTSAFDKAKAQGRKVLDSLQRGDTITIILMCQVLSESYKEKSTISLREIQTEYCEVSSEKKIYEITKFWDDLVVTEGIANVFTTLENVHTLLQQSQAGSKRIFIFSDFQKNSWERTFKNARYQEMISSIEKNCQSLTWNSLETSDPQNLGIVDLNYDGVITTNVAGRFIAKLCNYGSKTCQDASITFSIDGQKQKTEYLSIPGKQEQEISFYATFLTAGNHYVTAELAPDNLMQDNIRHISMEVLERIDVLILDGDPQEGGFSSESGYFLATLGDSDVIKADRILPNELGASLDLKKYDVLVLANVADVKFFLSMEANHQSILENFVKNGGGVWICLGDKVSSESYNEDLYNSREILPGRLGQIIGNIASDRNFTTSNIDQLEPHRIWRFFLENPNLLSDLKQCFIYRYFDVEVSQDDLDENIKVLAYYCPRKAPAILERQLGKGKILLTTTTLDKAWNNFHTGEYGHVFVIIANEFLQYLVGRSYESNNNILPQPLSKDYDFYVEPEFVQIVTPLEEIRAPQWKNVKANATTDIREMYRMYYNSITKSGIYRLKFSVPLQTLQERPELNKLLVADASPDISKPRHQLQEYFSVNVAAEEGNIHCYTQEELGQQLQQINVKYEKDVESKIQQSSQKDSEYWRLLAWVILCLTCTESILAMLFGRYGSA